MSQSRRRRWSLFALVGVAAVAVALSPALAAAVPVEGVVDLLGNDYFLVAVLGLVALAVAGWLLGKRLGDPVEQAQPPAPETVPDAPPPGERFDDCLGRWPGRLDDDERAWLRRRLRTHARRTEMRTGTSRETAVKRVETGSWTADPVAARYLGTEGGGPTVAERLRLAARGKSWAQYAAQATARELLGSDER